MSSDEAAHCVICCGSSLCHLMRHSLCYLMRQFTMSSDEAVHLCHLMRHSLCYLTRQLTMSSDEVIQYVI